MGDRTNANLRLWGIVDDATADAVYDAISSETGFDEAAIKEAIERAKPGESLSFESIYPDDYQSFAQVLKDAKVSFRWKWEDGDGYAAGILLYDARTGKTYRYPLIDGAAVLRLGDIRKPGAIEKAEEFAQVYKETLKLRLHRANSAHEKLPILSDHPELAIPA